MKRFWPYLLGLILVAGAVVVVWLALDNAKNNKSQPPNSSNLSVSSSDKTACSIFTLAEAKQLLGTSAKGGVNAIYDTPQGDLKVTSCTYSQDSGSNAPVASKKTASLIVHSPLTPAGAQSNASQFGQVKPIDAENVSGFGDSAYWDAKHGQLNILKHDTWYNLSLGPVTPSARTLDETKQLADLLIAKM